MAHCSAVINALASVLQTIAGEANAGSLQAAAKDATGKGQATTTASSSMLKSKRLKPLLGCLSSTVKAFEREKGPGLLTTAGMREDAAVLRAALAAVGEASASLNMQLLCDQVAGELDIIDGKSEFEAPGVTTGADERMDGVKEDDGKGKSKSPKSTKKKRKAAEEASEEGTVGIMSNIVDAVAQEEMVGAHSERNGSIADNSAEKKKKKKKKRRESEEAGKAV